MSGLHDIIVALDVLSDTRGETFYVKAEDVGDRIGLCSRAVGVRLAHIREDDTIPVDIEKWSKTSGATTYKVTLDDSSAVRTYLYQNRGVEEPPLTA